VRRAKRFLEQPRNDAHARHVRPSPPQQPFHAPRAGPEIPHPTPGLRSIAGRRGRHALKGIEEPHGARQPRVRRPPRKDRRASAAVHAAFHHVPGNLLVFDPLGQTREVLDACGPSMVLRRMSQALDFSLHCVLRSCSRLMGFACSKSPAGNQRHRRSFAKYIEQPPDKKPRTSTPPRSHLLRALSDLCLGSSGVRRLAAAFTAASPADKPEVLRRPTSPKNLRISALSPLILPSALLCEPPRSLRRRLPRPGRCVVFLLFPDRPSLTAARTGRSAMFTRTAWCDHYPNEVPPRKPSLPVQF